MPVTSHPLAFLRDPVVWHGSFAHDEALSIRRTVFDLFFKEAAIRALVSDRLGLVIWLAVEAGASIWFGVWLNVGVDAGVFALFTVPLLRR